MPSRLYHLAEARNVASILRHGLSSTSELLRSARLSDRDREAFVRRHRPTGITLPNGAFVRDQKPMPPHALERALRDGLRPEDWYELVNGFVFFWPDPERLRRHRGAFGDRPQVVLEFDAATILRDFAEHAFVSPINVGNARRRAAPRGRETIVPLAAWQAAGWPNATTTSMRRRRPAEVLLATKVPVRAPYVISIAEARSSTSAAARSLDDT